MPQDYYDIKKFGVPLLLCEHHGVDLSTPTGEYFLGQLVLNSELEGKLAGKRTKDSLDEAKCRGVKLGTHNPKVAGHGAKAQHDKALHQAKRLAPHVRKLQAEGLGAPAMVGRLNQIPAAVAIMGRPFTRGTMQRVLKRLPKSK